MKSTNGRAEQRDQGIRRRSTRVLSELWPGLVARWAEQVFLTPGRKTLSPAEQVMLATGHRFSVPVAGKRLAAWSWGDGPTVFLVHGWGSSAGRMTSFVDPLVRAGFSAVAFDGPGHGESEGTTSSIVEMAQALRAMTEWTAAADAVRGHAGAIGHSMGGGAIALASHQGLVFKRAVFLATPADLETPSREFAAREGLTTEAVLRMQDRIETRFALKWRDLALPRLVPERPFPLLLVHDTDDATVPVSEAAVIASAWPGAERMVTTGLGHHRIVHDPTVVRQVVAFLS